MPSVFISPSTQEYNPYVDGGNEEFKKLSKDDVSEDIISGLQDDLQKLTDSFIKKIDSAEADKEKEIMTV